MECMYFQIANHFIAICQLFLYLFFGMCYLQFYTILVWSLLVRFPTFDCLYKRFLCLNHRLLSIEFNYCNAHKFFISFLYQIYDKYSIFFNFCLFNVIINQKIDFQFKIFLIWFRLSAFIKMPLSAFPSGTPIVVLAQEMINNFFLNHSIDAGWRFRKLFNI